MPDATPAPSALRGAAPRAVVVAIALVFFVTGLRGIDFGAHWDEARHLNAARATAADGVLLPRTYWYPSMTYALTVVAALPDLVTHDRAALQTQSFTFRVRTLFLALSTLAIPLVFAAVVRFRKRPWEGALAAAFLGTSWELAYHARWIAPDTILATLAALLLFTLVDAPKKRAWLYASAVVAGLATGSKYTAGLMLIPCLVAAWQLDDARASRMKHIAIVCAIFGVTYLVVTPGTLLEASRFWWDLTRQAAIYGETGHKGYTPDGHIAYAFSMVRYFACALFSHFWPIAVAVFAFVFLGLRRAFVDDKRATILLGLFAALFIAFFATQKTLIVRNLLVVAPTLAVFAAIGVADAFDRVRRVRASIAYAFVVVIVAAIVVNAAFLVYAGETVHDRRTDRFLRELVAYLDAHADEVFVASPRVKTALAQFEHHGREQLVDAPTERTTKLLGYAQEIVKREEWTANDPFLTLRWFGPLEVNFNVYPTWAGDDRVVLMELEKARAMHIPLASLP